MDALVHKINYDTLKFTPHELEDNRDAEGRSARERILERLEKHEEDSTAYPLGKLWYDEIRTVFRSAESPHKQLQAIGQEATGTLSEDLVDAMKVYKSSGNRDALLNYAALAEAITRPEAVGLAMFALEINPHSGKDQLKAACALLLSLSRLGVKDKFEDIWKVLGGWLDTVTLKIHKSKKGKQAWPKEFCASNREIVTTVLPAVALDKVLAHVGAWKHVEAELLACTETALGKRLFGGHCLNGH